MKRITLVMSLMAGLASSHVYATPTSTLMATSAIDLTGSQFESATINRLNFKLADFAMKKQSDGSVTTLSQGDFVFERGYDDGFVGPAGYFQTDSIVTCSQPAARITSLSDFSAFPPSENPFPIFGLSTFKQQKPAAESTSLERIGLRLYHDKSVMNFSGLEKIVQGEAANTLSAITAQFGQPSFVLKRKNGIRAVYLEQGVDAAAVQLAYENALDPQKTNNVLNMTPSTVLYGVLLDASLNSEMTLPIKGEALEFYIGDEYMIFTKYAETGKFIERVSRELEKCDSTAL